MKSDSHLLASKDQPLLYRRNALLLFHALLYPRDLVVGLDVEFDLFACEGTDSVRWRRYVSEVDPLGCGEGSGFGKTYLICMVTV